MSEARPRRHLGEIVAGRYLVDRLVGEGSFAWVYHALSRSGRSVAVKVLHSAEPSAGLRFAREIRVLKALPRDRYVPQYVADGTTSDGRLMLVLEYVDGITLKRAMERTQVVEPRKAVAFLAELCQAFVGLHRLGVVHRDVKPENILLARSGAIKLIDFGLIRDAQGILQLLEREEDSLGERLFAHEVDTGVLAGTPEYMAPEQFADAAAPDLARGRTDTSSDVFSLGVILFQLLTGRKPFPMIPVPRDDYPAELLRYFNERIRLGDDDLPAMTGIPPALQSVIRKALRADPRARQPDARVFRDDLARYLTTGRGVSEADEPQTVSVVVDQIFGPGSSIDEAFPDLAAEAEGEETDADEGDDETLPPLYPDEETTAVHGRGRRSGGEAPWDPGSPDPFEEGDSKPTLTDVQRSRAASAARARAEDGMPTDPDVPTEPPQPPTDESMQPGPRSDRDPAPAPPPVPPRKRSEAGRRVVYKKPPSIFEQDTRRVNVAEIMPDEVRGTGEEK